MRLKSAGQFSENNDCMDHDRGSSWDGAAVASRFVPIRTRPTEGAFAMASGAHGTSRLAYPGTLAMLALALPVPRRPDGLQPDADVRAGLGTVRRDGDLLLGRSDPGPRAALALEERARLRGRPEPAQARQDRRDGGTGRRRERRQDRRRRAADPARADSPAHLHGRGHARPDRCAAHGAEPRGLGARPGAGRRPVHADSLHPLSLAGHRLHRHGRGDLEGADEHQPGPADGQEPRRVHEQPDERDLGLADRLRQHAAGAVPERGPDAGADPGLPPLGGPAGAGRPLGGRAPPAPLRLRHRPGREPGRGDGGRRSTGSPRRSSGSDRRWRASSAAPRRSAGSAPTSKPSAARANRSAGASRASAGSRRRSPPAPPRASSSTRSSAESSGPRRPSRHCRTRGPRPTSARAGPTRNSSPAR